MSHPIMTRFRSRSRHLDLHLYLYLILILGLAGCDANRETSSRGPRVTIDTIGGIERVTSFGRDVWEVDGGWRIDVGGAIEIGTIDGAEPFVFGEVSGVVVGEDGRIYIADTQAKEVRIFSAEGDYLSRFGRDGDGPGEFRNISGLGRAPGGGIAALDGSLARVSLFDPEGEFERFLEIRRPYMIFSHGAPVRFDREGRYYDHTGLSIGLGADTAGVVRYSAAGEVEDTVVTAVHEPRRVTFTRNDVPVMRVPVPFAPVPTAASSSDGQVYAAGGEAYAIVQLEPRADTIRIIHRDAPAIPVNREERDSALAELEERHREITGAALRESPEIPDRHPAILKLHIDEEGLLWVLRGGVVGEEGGLDGDQSAWDVLDPGGRYLGSLTLPSLDVMHIGERSIAGVAHDELGVATVKVLPLERR